MKKVLWIGITMSGIVLCSCSSISRERKQVPLIIRGKVTSVDMYNDQVFVDTGAAGRGPDLSLQNAFSSTKVPALKKGDRVVLLYDTANQVVDTVVVNR